MSEGVPVGDLKTNERTGWADSVFSCFSCGIGNSKSALLSETLGLFCPRCKHPEEVYGRYSAEEEAALIDLAMRHRWTDPRQVAYLGKREVWNTVRGRTLKSAMSALERLLAKREQEPWRWADPDGAELVDYAKLAQILPA